MKLFKRALAIIGICICVFTASIKSFGEVPYKTYTVDGYGYISETQTAYTPYSSITKIGDKSLVMPMDIKITDDGKMYIADAGAGVVYVSDLKGNLSNVIGEGILKEPTGIYVSEDHVVYVADKGGNKVDVFDSEGNLINSYGKPDHPLYGSGDFRPMKITVNPGGDMYIICEGNGNGIVQISSNEGGVFLGYFGTNYAQISFLRMIQEMVFTDEQLAKMVKNLPATPVNLCIDNQGLIYTITPSDNIVLKKLNIAGNNLIETGVKEGKEIAVAIGNYDNILVASSDGYIYEYTSEGELLFIFGGRDDGRFRIGLSKKVEAIDVDANDNIYILDSDSKQIQVFETTEFTDYLHEALNLYVNGRYTESKEPLEKVLDMNSLFDYANKAMGRAYQQEENYDQALKYAKLSQNFEGYSDAFWEVRNEWLKENIVSCIGIVIAVVIIWKLLKLGKRKGMFHFFDSKVSKITNKKLIIQIRYLSTFMKHPIDGCYAVRWEGKCSYLCANIILSTFTILTIINKYYCGFLLKTVREGRYDLVSDIGKVFIVFFVLTICCYLMCTINDGEGTFKQLYCGFAYSLAPLVIFLPFIILLGNVITYNEVFLVSLSNTFVTVWMLILIFIAIKEINNYSVKETIKIIFLTLFTVLILALLAFILYVLCRQVVEFVTALYREVVYRIGQ